MKDAQDSDNEPSSDMHLSPAQRGVELDSLSLDRLDAELFNAIMQASPELTSEGIDRLDDGLDGQLGEEDEEDNEKKQKRSVYALLVELKPAVASLSYWEPAGQQ